MKCHMSVSIEGALRMCRSKSKADVRQVLAVFDRGNREQLIIDLEKMAAKGYEVVPFDSCDNQEPSGRCAGHPDKEPNK